MRVEEGDEKARDPIASTHCSPNSCKISSKSFQLKSPKFHHLSKSMSVVLNIIHPGAKHFSLCGSGNNHYRQFYLEKDKIEEKGVLLVLSNFKIQPGLKNKPSVAGDPTL